MLTLFVVGGFWFWTILVIELIVLSAFVYNDSLLKGIFSLIVFFTALHFLGDFSLYRYVLDHPINILCYIGFYILSGIPWSIFRWYSVNKGILKQYNEEVSEYLKSNNISDVASLDADQKENLKHKISYSYYTESTSGNRWRINSQPNVNENKETIIGWLTFWPISMVVYFLSEFIINIFKNIFEALRGYYQKISDSFSSKRTEI